MKSILISIKPEQVANILNGKKTIEIRKTMPKCELPIDVYIYCKKSGKRLEARGWKNCGVSICGTEFQKVFGVTKVTVFLKSENITIYIGNSSPFETTADDLIAIGQELKKLEEN